MTKQWWDEVTPKATVVVDGVELQLRRDGSPIVDRHPTREEMKEIWRKLEQGIALSKIEFLRFQSVCRWSNIMGSAYRLMVDDGK